MAKSREDESTVKDAEVPVKKMPMVKPPVSGAAFQKQLERDAAAARNGGKGG